MPRTARSDLSERIQSHLDAHAENLGVELREQSLRQEKILREMFEQISAFMATQTKLTEEIVAGLGEVRDEVRAQRKALLAILDRLPPPAESA
jgi:hypothetical protein